MSLSSSHDSSSHSSSAIIFSSDLIHHLENSCRLPSTYIGVRQIRPTFTCDGGSVGASSSNDGTRKRKRNDSSSSSFGNNSNDDDDAWVSNNNCNVRIQSTVDNDTQQQQQQPETTSNSGNTSTDNININSSNEVTRDVISYKVTNPDGTQRRMTTQEKKQLKYKLNLVKQQAKKDERQRQHKQRILDAKEGKKERKKLKRSLAAWKKKKQQQNDQQQNEEGLDDVMITNCIGMNDTQDKFEHQSTFCKINQQPDDWGGQDESTIDDAESTSASILRGEVKDVPPVMLTPAATCIAQDMDLLSSQCCGGESKQSTTTTTCGRQTTIIIIDPSLSLQWATQLQQSMIPAETTRGKEDMRPMAYKIVPEVWKRLCPETVVDSGAQKEEGVDKSKKRCDLSLDKAKAIQLTSSTPTTHHGHSNNDSSSQELVILRNPSPFHDTDACIIFKYLHTTYPNLHIACGAVFGCDFLLYNGKRDATHSFAGLRIYSCCRHNSSHATIRSNNITGKDGVLPQQQQQLPIPTAYDMTGFVRTMNTAKKIALVATVVREEATREDERSDGDVTISDRVAIVDLALKKVL